MLSNVCLLLFCLSLIDAKPWELISGNWSNELKSLMQLEAKSDGTLTGFYQTAVVSDEEKNSVPVKSPIHGTFQLTDDGALLAFNVQWRFEEKTEPGHIKYSVTSWTGKLFFTQPNELKTTWLLLKDTSVDELWFSVVINKDHFERLVVI